MARRSTTSGRVTKVTGKTAAAKAAKARIAAGKSAKAKGAQTAAGKARAALSKSARAEAAAAKAAEAAAAESGSTAAATRPSKPGDQGLGREVDGDQERDQVDVQGQRDEGRPEEDRQQELTRLARAPSHLTAPGSTRGVVMFRQTAEGTPSFVARRLGSEHPVQQRAAQATGRRDRHDHARDRELLRPVEGR